MAEASNGRIRTRTDKVHAALRRAIIEQRLAPGSRLPEDAIGDSFGTSRTIAREALGRLSVEGLVDLIPNRGAFVAHPSLAEARDIFAVRKGLERMVITALAGRITPKIAQDLRLLVEAEANLADHSPEIAIHLTGEFHLRLAERAGNRLLERYVREVVSRCSLVLAMYGRPHSATCGACEHAAIVEALIAGDADAAGGLMEAHLNNVAGRALLATEPPPDVRAVLGAFARDLDES